MRMGMKTMVSEVIVQFTRRMWTKGRPSLPVEKFDPPVTIHQLATILKQRWRLWSIRVDSEIATATVEGH